MFGLCRKITKKQITPTKITYSAGYLKAIKNKGNNKQQSMVPTDTYLENQIVKKAITAVIPKIIGLKAKSTPKPVAAPLPPLNFTKSDKECPTMAIAPIKICKNDFSGNKTMVNKTGKKPFKPSKKKTKIAHFMPKALKTLVAPMFPEPTFLKSIPLILATTKPKGTEPKKYVAIARDIIKNIFYISNKAQKESALRLAPPTKAPSISFWLISSFTLSGFTDPPY